MFKLEHPFKRAATANSFAEGDLRDNLMEYYGGTSLVKLQWDAIHHPGTVIGIFERDEDAMQAITACTAGIPSWNGSKEGEATFTFGEVVSAYDGLLKGKEKPECYKTWYWNVKQNKWLTPNEYHKIKKVSNNQILFNKNTDEFFENDDSFEGHVYNHNRLEKSTRYSLMPISSILSENEMYQLAFLRAFQLDDFKIEDNYYLDLTFKAALDHVYYFFTESTIAKTEGGAKDIDPNAESGLENVTLALFASSTDSINEAVRLIKHSNSIFFKFDWGTTLGYIISPFAPKMNSVLIKVSNKVEQSIFKAGGYLRVRAVDWAKKFSGVKWRKIQSIKNKYPNESLPLDGELYGIAQVENGTIIIPNKGNLTYQNVDFVITKTGELKIGKKHIFLSNKMDVEAAGTLRITNGKVKRISNSSGHYFPTIEETSKFPYIFKQLGLDVDGVALETLYLENNILKSKTIFWYRRLGRRDIYIFAKWTTDFIWEQTQLNFTDAFRAMKIAMNIYQA